MGVLLVSWALRSSIRIVVAPVCIIEAPVRFVQVVRGARHFGSIFFERLKIGLAQDGIVMEAARME